MKKAFLIIFLFNVFRLILIPYLNILPNEAFYIGLQGHGLTPEPTTASFIQYLIDLMVMFFGKNILVIRFIFLLLSFLTQWSLFLLIVKIIRPNKKYLAWVTISSTMLVTLLSITSLSDSLLLLFWILSILSLYNAIFDEDRKSWLISSIFMGLAILNKLTGLALPAGLIIFLIFSSRYRKYLFTSAPYISLIVTGFISIPIWMGLLKTQNPAMQIHQIETITEFFQVSANPFTTFIGFQAVLIFPVLYIGLWWVTFKYFGRIFKKPNQINSEFWFLLSFFLPLFLGFHLISFFSWVDFLGLIPVYITGLILLLKLIKTRWIYWSIGFSIALHFLLLMAIIQWV